MEVENGEREEEKGGGSDEKGRQRGKRGLLGISRGRGVGPYWGLFFFLIPKHTHQVYFFTLVFVAAPEMGLTFFFTPPFRVSFSVTYDFFKVLLLLLSLYIFPIFPHLFKICLKYYVSACSKP